jgi:sulfate transport system permease protein
VIVVLPIAALIWESSGRGLSGFWDVVSSEEAVSALKLTVEMAGLAAIVNAVFGTVIAWVLVRDEFPGKSLMNSVIDLPFALPTIVAGLVITALYGIHTPLELHTSFFDFKADVTFTKWAILIALLFVTLPFVVRTVQPVLIELDREMEEAARSLGASELSTFRRIVLPNILPGILSGMTMGFARGVGEIGAIILITGNLPFKTEVASVFVFQRIASDPHGSAAVSVVLLSVSFLVLLAIGGLRRYATRFERAEVLTPFRRSRLFVADPDRPARDDGLADVGGSRRRVGRSHQPQHAARVQAHVHRHGDRRPDQHRLRDRVRPRDRAGEVPRSRPAERLRRLAARVVPGDRRVLARPALRGQRMVQLAPGPGRPDSLRAAGDRARDRLRLSAVRRP